MGRTRTDEFRKDAVRIALTSGLTEGQVGLIRWVIIIDLWYQGYLKFAGRFSK